MVRINNDGYVERARGGGVNSGTQAKYRDWYFGKHHMNILIKTLPKKYWGKHIKIKIEIITLEKQ